MSNKGQNSQLVDSTEFSGRDLSGRDFSNKVLIGVDFSNSNCSGCDFSYSDLSFANFKGANLYRASFVNSILYVTYFVDCDLTRANCDSAYIYGVKFVGMVNITYCDFSNLSLESERRVTAFPQGNSNYQEIQLFDSITGMQGFGNSLRHTALKDHYGPKFTCNSHYMEFVKYRPYEKEMQLSQIHNRLKRIFKENNFYTEAGNFYYLEKYWETKSWFTQGTKEDFHFKRTLVRVFKTLFAKLNQIICGYGERPTRVLFWILIGLISFSIPYYFGPFEEIPSSKVNVVTKIGLALYHSICSFTTLGSQNLTPLGINAALTAIESFFGVVMITLLTATIIRKLIRD